MKITNQMREAAHNETATEVEARKELIRVETGESCVCRKCDDPLICEHNTSEVHEQSLCGNCA